MGDILRLLGFKPVGVNQYPRKSVSWTPHSHLAGLTIKLLFSRIARTLRRETRWESHVLLKTPKSSM